MACVATSGSTARTRRRGIRGRACWWSGIAARTSGGARVLFVPYPSVPGEFVSEWIPASAQRAAQEPYPSGWLPPPSSRRMPRAIRRATNKATLAACSLQPGERQEHRSPVTSPHSHEELSRRPRRQERLAPRVLRLDVSRLPQPAGERCLERCARNPASRRARSAQSRARSSTGVCPDCGTGSPIDDQSVLVIRPGNDLPLLLATTVTRTLDKRPRDLDCIAGSCDLYHRPDVLRGRM